MFEYSKKEDGKIFEMELNEYEDELDEDESKRENRVLIRDKEGM